MRPRLVARCRDEGVQVSAVGANVVRAVTHLDVSGRATAEARRGRMAASCATGDAMQTAA